RSNCIRGALSVRGSGVKRRRRRAFFHTKVLFRHCSVNFTSRKHQKRVKPRLMRRMPGLRDIFHFEDLQLVLTPGNAVLPVTESHADVYMEPENDFQTPMETVSKETTAFPSKPVESYKGSQESSTTVESECPWMPEQPLPMESEPSRSVGFLENSIT
ncbi:hypothetical protein N331_03987, partial [Merops nubicus]